MNIFARELVQLLEEHGKGLGNLYNLHTESHQIFSNKVFRLKHSLEEDITATLNYEDLKVLANWLSIDPEGKEIQRLRAAREAEVIRYRSGKHMSKEAAQEQGELTFQSLLRGKSPPQSTRPKVFISHSHKDDNFTTRFVEDLRAAGVEVWVDTVNMKHGNFITRIDEGLNASEWLVLVLTPEAIASKPVQTEVNAAINRVWRNRMKGFIPFMALPCDDTIPAIWDAFHRYDATSDYKSALAGLLRALGVED